MGRQAVHKRNGQMVDKVIEQREDALSQMPTKLRKKFNQIVKKMDDLRAENLRAYYKLGKICLEIRDNPSEYIGHDGRDGIKLIEDALHTQARTLRKFMQFADNYDEPELETLIAMKHTETGFCLHWGHVSFLLTLDTKGKRERYALEAVEKMMDPEALHEYIKKHEGREGGHGRSHAMPATIPAQVRQIRKLTDTWLAKNEKVWDGEGQSVFDNVANMPPEDMDQDLLSDLMECRELMLRISEGATHNVPTLDRLIRHVDTCIQNRTEDAHAAASPALSGGGRGVRRIDTGAATAAAN